jgi:hypothetical protein
MAEDKTIIMPDNQNGWGNGFFGNGGFGAGILGGILGGLIPGFFGNWGNGFGGFGGGNNNAAAALSAQATANNNTDMLLQAINGTDADVRLLASTLNTDLDSVRLAVNTVQGAIGQLSASTGLSAQQIINSIQSGNSTLSRQLCECCCENRLLTTQQGYQSQIRTIEQTNQLGSQADRNTASITAAIAALQTSMTKEFCDVKEREMQGKIDTLTANNALLQAQINNASQTAQFAAMLAPLSTKLAAIESKMPNTIPVTYPNVSAVNNTPYGGGYYGNGLVF